MFILGIVLIVIGLLVPTLHVLFVIGLILAIVGGLLWLMALSGHGVGRTLY